MFWYADNEVASSGLPSTSPRGFMLLQYYTTFMEQNSSLKSSSRGSKEEAFLICSAAPRKNIWHGHNVTLKYHK